MSIRSLLLAVVTAIAAFGSAASATPVAANYDAFSHLEGNPLAPEHSLWFSGNNNPAGTTGDKRNHFLFENSADGKGLFSVSGMAASLTGIVRNAAGQGFEIMLNLIEATDPGVYKGANLGDESSWTFYRLDPHNSSMLNSLTAGIASFDISLRGEVNGMPLAAQFGVGANDKNAGLLGFSTWVSLTEKNCGPLAQCESYDGDINILLETAAVPVPASIALLPTALGLFGFFGWRRRKQA